MVLKLAPKDLLYIRLGTRQEEEGRDAEVWVRLIS